MSPKERALVAAILIDKRALLRGEPTQIVDVRDHRRMDEVGKELVQEMRRRGITLDVAEYQSVEEPMEASIIPAEAS